MFGFGVATLAAKQILETGEAPVAHTFSKGFSALKMNPQSVKMKVETRDTLEAPT